MTATLRQILALCTLGFSVASYGSDVLLNFHIESVCALPQSNGSHALQIRGYAPAVPVIGNPPLEQILNRSMLAPVVHLPHKLFIEDRLVRVIGKSDGKALLYFIFVPFEFTQVTPLSSGAQIQINRGGRIETESLATCRPSAK